jgi:hypothetical protein
MRERNVPNESYFHDWVDVWVDWCTQTKIHCTLNIAGIDARADWAFYLTVPSWLWAGIYDAPSPADKAAIDVVIRDFFDLDVAKQDANRAAFITLWKFIANRYKDSPYVMFGIMNEPFCLVDVSEEATPHLRHSYSAYMEQIVDGIRSTGAAQPVLIDQPFLWDATRNWEWTVEPVNREGIVWEAHLYVNTKYASTLEAWEGQMDGLVRQFTAEFKKPLIIGEYSIDPITDIRTAYASDWRAILSGQVAYMDHQPLLGRQFLGWDGMYGEYANYDGASNLTAEESEWIIETVLTK